MADLDVTASPPEDDLLDLTALAQTSQPVLTSAGRLMLRKLTSLGPLDRTRVFVLRARTLRAGARLDALTDDASEAEMQTVAQATVDAEDDLLRVMLADVTDEQLEALPAPERVGLIAAFFGASPAEAQQAVGLAMELMAHPKSPPRGRKRSRGSSASTAATPSAG